MSSDAIHVFAILTAAEGKADPLRAALSTLVPETRKEPGCIQYTLHEASAAPGTFYVYEVYKDQAAVEAHMNSPYLQAVLAKAGPLLGNAPSIVPTKQIA
ncbi:MAG: putative quinol monooxygenase [Acidocella sp.]|nr:putative quinol monooxygenase [Acidocella sp.]